MMFDYQARLVQVTDGDTIRLLIDHGMYIRSEHAIRLRDVWAPERNQPGGTETTAFVAGWFTEHGVHGALSWPVHLVTERDRQTFNRYVGAVTCAGCGQSLNEAVTEYVTAEGFSGGVT